MAKLTGDQVIAIQGNQDFFNRIEAALKVKAQYWLGLAPAAISDYNKRMQLRKRFAKTISSTSAPSTSRQDIGQFWLGWFAWQVDMASSTYDQGQGPQPYLDANGIPTFQCIFDHFDAAWDQFAYVQPGDENKAIDW